LCTSFFYGKNGLAWQFPEKFKNEVPENAIALAAAAVRDSIIYKLLKHISCPSSWNVASMSGRMGI
jgi:hypothetical protein